MANIKIQCIYEHWTFTLNIHIEPNKKNISAQRMMIWAMMIEM